MNIKCLFKIQASAFSFVSYLLPGIILINQPVIDAIPATIISAINYGANNAGGDRLVVGEECVPMTIPVFEASRHFSVKISMSQE